MQVRSNAYHGWAGYIWAVLITVINTLIGHVLYERLDLSNLVMVFLLGVVFIAMRFGRGPSIVASLLGVGTFDLFFVAPYLSLSPANSQYLITLLAMLVVAIVISNLMINVKSQAMIAAYRERMATALYAMSKELGSCQTEQDIVCTAVRHLSREFNSRTVILFADDAGNLHYPKAPDLPESLRAVDLTLAQWALDNDTLTGQDSHNHMLYFPLHDEDKIMGVLALLPSDAGRINLPEQQQLLETLLRQLAQALSRLRFAEQAKSTQIQIEAERLRNSLLSAISHDLRTPLSTIIGSASALADDKSNLQASDRLDLSRAIVDEAERMALLINNLLDMARLDAGKIDLNKQWYPVEEIIGSVLTRQHKYLQTRSVKVLMPSGIPMLYVDAVMIEQVLINLVENAIRYTPQNSGLEITVDISMQTARISVADHGKGIPEGLEEKLFEKFYQTRNEAAQSGVGLGLAICRAIVEAHGGHISASNRREGGAIFEMVLPLDRTPPVLAQEDE
ncbi:ATP-binding protein [Methylomonas rivi]|uniref:histidine kinase n=1 Tax=Methylomonas rivi TaxID=2952226 RepID=A0ABT1U166_9GAMM|nr:DUF4118 domain-containing protein [Methylomonas sp. WSC-6]